jgi:hypothetical protein
MKSTSLYHWKAAAFSLVAVALLPSAIQSADHQPSTITVTVIDALGRYPLGNADVIDLASGQHRITDEQGQVRLPWPNSAQLRVRVREVGYQPLERILQRATASPDSATFAMSKVAYVIAPVMATSHCATTGDSASLALSVAVLDQLKQGAEKYIEFRRLYPFEATVERRSALIPESGIAKRIIVDREKFRSENLDPKYRPGNVVQYKWDGSFLAPILFLSTLGDSVFWQNHCFIARGIESYQGTRAIRLEFSPSPNVRGPDWSGSAVLDSATSYLLRLEFHLANLDTRKGLVRLDGYQTFSSPSPFVMIPDSVVAIWWIRKQSRDDPKWGLRPDFVQSLHIDSLKYRKGRPPPYQAAKQ